MKTQVLKFTAAALLLIGALSCQSLVEETEGSLQVRIAESKASLLPDTEDYVLSIKGANGETIYEGRYGDSPEEFELKAGTYTVSALSDSSDEARFDAPLFGDSEEVVVRAGEKIGASLLCTQVNCGLRLRPDARFTEAFPGGILYVKGNGGRLMYGYTEKRTGYFKPGKATISVSMSGKEQTLLSKQLNEATMLTLTLSASGAPEGITVKTDTARIWTDEDYVWGEDSPDKGIDGAMDVEQARESAGQEDVWVKGYVVGCAVSGSRYEFTAPFSKSTNILLGLRSGTSESQWCISVELKNKTIREALNLQDNPELKGKFVYIRGDLVSAYYGLPGLKNVSEFKLDY